MAIGLTWEQVQTPAYVFEQSREFVETFGAHIGAAVIDPMKSPLEYAERVALLNPRHPDSVFNDKDKEPSHEYADRYAQADKSMPSWAAVREDVILNTAHVLGVRDRELGTTFQHDFSPQGHFNVGVALEGANNQDISRSFAMADAIGAGEIEVDEMVVAVTDRTVGEREPHADLKIGYAVGAMAVTELHKAYPDIFGAGGVRLHTLDVRTREANTREAMTETALVLNAGSIVMAGSNIYGSWMRTDLATVQHTLRLKKAGFGAGVDDSKAARTTRIWTAEVAQTLVSAAHLQHARKTKNK